MNLTCPEKHRGILGKVDKCREKEKLPEVLNVGQRLFMEY
jgi:hypothetical protein